MSYTVRKLISASLRKIGALEAGEPLSSDEGADALDALTGMVSLWSLETLMIPVTGVVTIDLVEGVSEYTIGIKSDPDADVLSHKQVARPEKIVSSFIRDESGTDYPVDAIYATGFANISRKANVSRASRMYVRTGWPLSTILFASAPYASDVLHLEVLSPLSTILPTSTLDTIIDMPPGFLEAITYGLALRLASEYGRQITSDLVGLAAQSKALIQRSNYKPSLLTVDNALLRNRRGSYSDHINGGYHG